MNRGSSGSSKQFLFILLLGVMIWGGAWGLQSYLAGTKPTSAYVPSPAQTQPQENAPDPELDNLRQAAAIEPVTKESLFPLAQALMRRIEQLEPPPQDLLLEAIDVMRKILALDPHDGPALLAMADLSFNSQVFDKAVQYYERYLAENSGDNNARARYASALSFIGRGADGISVLNDILAKEPTNFHAAAYLAISYMQAGEKARALEAGEKALTLAPTKEARARFSQFIEAVKQDAVRGTVGKEAQKETPTTLVSPLEQYLKNHPMIGAKFVGMNVQGGSTIALYFRDFPMEAMPPFAKEKFLSSIKAELAKSNNSNIKKVIFIDELAGRQMAVMEVSESTTP